MEIDQRKKSLKNKIWKKVKTAAKSVSCPCRRKRREANQTEPYQQEASSYNSSFMILDRYQEDDGFEFGEQEKIPFEKAESLLYTETDCGGDMDEFPS